MINADHMTRSLLQAQVNDITLAYRRMTADALERNLTVNAIFKFS